VSGRVQQGKTEREAREIRASGERRKERQVEDREEEKRDEKRQGKKKSEQT